jgi:hypothetical protein
MKVETSSMSTRSAASPKLKALWFLQIGSRSEDYNRISYNKSSEQVRMGQKPPRASLNLQRSLFLDSGSVNRTLTARESSSPTARPSSSTSRRSVVAPLPHPSISPAVEVEEGEANEVRGLGVTNTAAVVTPCRTTRLEQAAPFLDQFVGERDKKDLSKLLGVVQECFNILTPTRNNHTLKITATNGRDQLLVMVPQCHKGGRGLMKSESHSHWVGDMFRHTMTSEHLGARVFARLIARNHPDEFELAAKEELDIEPMKRMGIIECEAIIQDGNLTFNQFRKVCKHVERRPVLVSR